MRQSVVAVSCSPRLLSGFANVEFLWTDRGLEWQIVCAVLTGRLLCGRERCCIVGGRCSGGSGRLYGSCGLCISVDGPCVDAIEPAAVVFMCINVERHGQLFSALYVELLDSFFSEYTEATFAWVLVVSLDNVFL